MSKSTTRNRAPAAKRPKSRGKPADEQRRHSDDIERAVFDGMQDLRQEKKPSR